MQMIKHREPRSSRLAHLLANKRKNLVANRSGEASASLCRNEGMFLIAPATILRPAVQRDDFPTRNGQTEHLAFLMSQEAIDALRLLGTFCL